MSNYTMAYDTMGTYSPEVDVCVSSLQSEVVLDVFVQFFNLLLVQALKHRVRKRWLLQTERHSLRISNMVHRGQSPGRRLRSPLPPLPPWEY